MISVIDASGKLSDGITSGGLWFTGSPDACIKVDTKGPPSNDTESFKGKYAMVAFGGPEDFPEEEAEEIRQMMTQKWKNGQALPRMPIFLPGPYLGIAGPSLVSILAKGRYTFESHTFKIDTFRSYTKVTTTKIVRSKVVPSIVIPTKVVPPKVALRNYSGSGKLYLRKLHLRKSKLIPLEATRKLQHQKLYFRRL